MKRKRKTRASSNFRRKNFSPTTQLSFCTSDLHKLCTYLFQSMKLTEHVFRRCSLLLLEYRNWRSVLVVPYSPKGQSNASCLSIRKRYGFHLVWFLGSWVWSQVKLQIENNENKNNLENICFFCFSVLVDYQFIYERQVFRCGLELFESLPNPAEFCRSSLTYFYGMFRFS